MGRRHTGAHRYQRYARQARGAVRFRTCPGWPPHSGEHRLRLFGSNFTAAADFPDHETAAKVAARMAKFGLNAVRFHFLDATWGTPKLINYESGDSRNWNADALDRLDYFIARLKEHGIYADLNLFVGRRFGVGDGVDATVNRLDWKAAHAVGFFHAPHMEAQKRYARQLLTHLNPYTKLTYVEDPAVALVEINNENGLIHTWLDGSFDALPARRHLQGQHLVRTIPQRGRHQPPSLRPAFLHVGAITRNRRHEFRPDQPHKPSGGASIAPPTL